MYGKLLIEDRTRKVGSLMIKRFFLSDGDDCVTRNEDLRIPGKHINANHEVREDVEWTSVDINNHIGLAAAVIFKAGFEAWTRIETK
jgi:hypothetical protein